MSEPLVNRADHGPVVVLTLNRPDRRNALSRALIAELGDALAQLAIEPSVRAIVLTGAGPAFCSGMDMKEATEPVQSGEGEQQAVDDIQAIADVIAQVHQSPKPVIAALNGDAYAGGAGLATACDFVIIAEHARIGYPEVKRGLVAAIVMRDLVAQVGARRAQALLLTGEPIGAGEAERWGLVNRVVPADRCLAEAIAIGQSLVAAGPMAVAETKTRLNGVTGLLDELRGEAAVSAAIRISPEAEEGMRAFLEKRPPRWASGAGGE
jgi:methylglutaconyl-CoA hydratase